MAEKSGFFAFDVPLMSPFYVHRKVGLLTSHEKSDHKGTRNQLGIKSSKIHHA